MFNLIVAVISIALIAAMAAASIFYGGTAFGEGTAKAQAATLINNGQQISGAQHLYRIDNSGNRATAIATLTGDYLQAVPTPPTGVTTDDWEIDNTGEYAFIALDDDNAGQQNSPAATVCEQLVEQGALSGHVLNDTTAVDANGVVATTGAGVLDTELGSSQFACVSSAADLNTVADNTFFVFKL